MEDKLVSLLGYLKRMAMIKDYEVFEDGKVGLSFHVPVFRLSHYEDFFAAFGYRVVEVRVEVMDGGEIYILLEEV